MGSLQAERKSRGSRSSRQVDGDGGRKRRRRGRRELQMVEGPSTSAQPDPSSNPLHAKYADERQSDSANREVA